MVIMGSLLRFRRSLCSLTTSSIRMLLTISPVTSTKSCVMICFASISLSASPTERASLEKMGVIFKPDPGWVQRDSLRSGQMLQLVLGKREIGPYALYCFSYQLDVRTTEDEYLLHARTRQSLERPVQQSCITHW